VLTVAAILSKYHHHLTLIIINLLIVPVIFKDGDTKAEYGQLFPHGNKEDEDLQHKGQADCGSNETKAKVRAIILELCATISTRRRSFSITCG
jgi:hypothetical protein